MKLLLVLGADDTYDHLSQNLGSLGFDLIRYNHIHKAMDNVDEIDPSAIIISARDFPRHWKTMVHFVRVERSREDCPIIILKGQSFNLEDSAKASFLGVSGIVDENLDDTKEMDRLQAILGRYKPVEKRRSRRFIVEPGHKFAFVFARPWDKMLINGEVKNISPRGLSFLPDHPGLLRDMRLNMELEDCSLRAGDTILSPVCRPVMIGHVVSIEFLSFPGEEQETLKGYIEKLPLMELKNNEKMERAS